MKIKTALGMIGLLILAAFPTLGASNAPNKKDKSAEARTLTGCLSASEGAGEYKLTTPEGATWELHSKSVKLAGHVGHTVTVTGHVRNAAMHGAKEKTKDEMKEHGMDKDATEHGHLRVTGLTMVSDSCKK